jgi:hypothetical protein
VCDSTNVFEEGEAGSKAMMNDGLFEDFPMEAVYGLHNWPGLAVGHMAMRTGAAMGAPVIVPLQTFPVQLVDGRLFVRVLREQMESLSETMPRPR